ncbi:MAG: flippase [Patescibacteria group bacterium]
MVKAKTLTQNTTYYTFALVFQKILAFVYFTFLARGLGVEDLGKYAFAFSFTTIFSVFVDVGMSSILTREIAKDRSRAKEILSNVLGMKLVLGFFVYLLVVALINILDYGSTVKILVYITGLIMLLDNFASSFWATLRGNQNLKYESLGIILFEVVVVGLGLILLFSGLGVIYIILSTLVGSTFFFFFSFYQMKKRLSLKIKIIWNSKVLKMLLKISWPFALMGIFARLNTQIDTVFLSKIGCVGDICDSNVGIYAIATKIALAIHFIPLAFTAALFPAFSEYFAHDKEKLSRTFTKSMKYMMVIGVPLSFGIYSLAPDFIPLVFGNIYTESILPLQILILGLVFMFLTFPVGSLLNAASRQLRNAVHVGIAVAVNIVLNIILIPKMTFVGAAIASFVSSLVILFLGLYIAPKIVKFRKMPLLASFLRTVISGGVMAVILTKLLFTVHFVILIPIGALIYFILLFLLGELKIKDIKEFLVSLRIKKN